VSVVWLWRIDVMWCANCHIFTASRRSRPTSFRLLLTCTVKSCNCEFAPWSAAGFLKRHEKRIMRRQCIDMAAVSDKAYRRVV
jgi:hypothetical protein